MPHPFGVASVDRVEQEASGAAEPREPVDGSAVAIAGAVSAAAPRSATTTPTRRVELIDIEIPFTYPEWNCAKINTCRQLPTAKVFLLSSKQMTIHLGNSKCIRSPKSRRN